MGRRRGARRGQGASGHTASACLLPGAVGADNLGWGCFHLWMFPSTLRLSSPLPARWYSCQNGCCTWHLPGSLFFFPGALSISTPILACLPAERGGSSPWAKLHVPSPAFSMLLGATRVSTRQRGSSTNRAAEPGPSCCPNDSALPCRYLLQDGRKSTTVVGK